MVQIEGVQVDDLVDWEIGLSGAKDLGDSIDTANPSFQGIHVGAAHQIGLVEQYPVGKGDLFLGFGGIVEMEVEVFCVNDRNDSIETEALLHLGI